MMMAMVVVEEKGREESKASQYNKNEFSKQKAQHSTASPMAPLIEEENGGND
jgi:hypothetical protein